MPRNALLTTCKSFIWPHLDYSSIVYDQPNNQNFVNEIEVVHYNAVLSITNTIKGTSRTKLYKELGIESLSFCRWFGYLFTFYEIKTHCAPKYLYKLIPLKNNTYDTRSTHSVGTYFCRTNNFKYSFFPYTIQEWNKLDLQLHNEKSFKKFRNTLFKLGWPTPDLIYRTHCPLDLKLLTRLRLGLSHLKENRFNHSFKNFINPLCTCSLEVESTKHFFLHCHYYSVLCISFLNNLNNISPQFALFPEDVFIKTLLYGNPMFDENDSEKILETSIRYILDSKRFSGNL